MELQRVSRWIATGFGLGLSPFAPGTVGTVLGIPIAAALSIGGLGWGAQVVWAACLALAAGPACDSAERQFGTKDDHRIVADEYLTFPICVIGLPWMEHLWLLPVAFVVNRVMDIIKPAPARQLQALRGGWGIVADDVMSSLYALIINHAVWCVSRSL
jgi:phosphatidylglycerophosphatase A